MYKERRGGGEGDKETLEHYHSHTGDTTKDYITYKHV